ncbi:MAG: tRNA uracil 4-sulfurtransferase ThiI [Nitrososphaeria archaeon]
MPAIDPRGIIGREAAVIHYSEVALKGGNRGLYEEALRGAAAAAVSDLEGAEVLRLRGRLLAVVGEGASAAAAERLRTVFGVSWVAPCRAVEPDMGRIREEAVAAARRCGGGARSFRIRASRDFKGFPANSLEIERDAGAAVAGATGLRVDLEAPDLEIWVEVLEGMALVCCGKERGPGGLPAGTNGRAVALLSGGIDSPVAAWLIARRGAEVDLLHLHPFEGTGDAALGKLAELAERIALYSTRTRLIIAPCWPVRFRLGRREGRHAALLFRLFALRLAARLAAERGYLAAVTGDSLGQVASQTLHNLSAVYRASGIAVLAPLAGMDKEEIVRIARSIGTYEISIRPYPDCCPAVAGRHPATRSSPEELLELYEGAGLEGAIDEAMDAAVELELERRGSRVLRSGPRPLARTGPRR